jgi:hypothetical protein
MAEVQGAKGWIKALVIGGVGGGIAGAFAAAMDPAKYQFPRDFGSGKLWKFFFQGALMTVGALSLKSPWGRQVVGSFKSTQAELQESQDTIAETKADLKSAVQPPPKEKP